MQPIAVGAAVVAAAAAAAVVFAARHRRRRGAPPSWLIALLSSDDYERLRVAEWERGPSWRLSNGWVGTDYAHGEGAAVHIADYGLGKTAKGYAKLVGAVHFSSGAESHKGLCHGGTMCTVMDDVIGWVGFCVSGTCKPWSGFTVQVNTSLTAPVKVGSWLRVEGEIYAVERRKVRIRASLKAPADEALGTVECVHCTAEGLFVIKKEEAS